MLGKRGFILGGLVLATLGCALRWSVISYSKERVVYRAPSEAEVEGNVYDRLAETDARVQAALAVCQPFVEETRQVAELTRSRLVARCVVAASEETIEVVIFCKDVEGVQHVQAKFSQLTASAEEPLVLKGRVGCAALVPFLQQPPKGVLGIEEQGTLRLYNAMASGPRFVGISSHPLPSMQGLGTYGLDGSGEVVAVIDTGICSGVFDTNFHPDLKAGLYGMVAEPSAATEVPVDLDGHGTHVCGSIISRGAQHAQTRGGAQGACLYMQGIGAGYANGIKTLSEVDCHFERSALSGAKIISNSWGECFSDESYSSGGYTARASQLDRFVWNNPEVLVLFAAGNDGKDADGDGLADAKTVISLENYAKNVLIVGAQESFSVSSETYGDRYGKAFSKHQQIYGDKLASPHDEKHDGMAVFSSQGPLVDGRITPMLVAPGTEIASTYYAHDQSYLGVAISDGTSMAAPQVAAAAAVLRQYLRTYHALPRPTAALVRAGLILCADSLTPGQYVGEISEASPNSVEGWGALHLGRHLAGIGQDGTKRTPFTFGFKDRIVLEKADASTSFTFTTCAEGEVRVVLSWIDYPDVASETQPLVNDYNLTVTDPRGVVYTLKDHLNPIERIIIEEGLAGTYTVTVRAAKIGKTGSGNLAAVAWSAQTVDTPIVFKTPTIPTEKVTLDVRLPADVVAYKDYPIWPAPGRHSFGKGDAVAPIAGPKLDYAAWTKHSVTSLAGWILFDAQDRPIRQHFPQRESVSIASGGTLEGAILPPEAPLLLEQERYTLQWYTTFPGYGVRLK